MSLNNCFETLVEPTCGQDTDVEPTAAVATTPAHAAMVRVGLPITGGRLLTAARERGYPVLFSANAFARTYPKGHEMEGYFKGFSLPDPEQFQGLDAALDSAGYVAAVRYGDYRWDVNSYYELVQAHPWTWHAAMDYCNEAAVAGDRPMRLLRIAATAQMLLQCRREAARRGLPAPMPVLQGYLASEYVLCAKWLPILEWPELVGIGSVCRRHLHGPDGLLTILQAVDAVLPPHTKLHLFGVKSTALELLARHPRVHSVDSQAWDMQARTERRTGRDMDFRISHMHAWTERQRAAIRRAPAGRTLPPVLFDPTEFQGLTRGEDLVLEALALTYCDLVMGGELEYADAVHHCHLDGVTAIAVLRREGWNRSTRRVFNGILDGFGTLTEEVLANGGSHASL